MSGSFSSGVPVSLLEWDSTFWGFTVGRVDTSTLSAEQWEQIDAWAQAAGVECLYLLAQPDDPKSLDIAQKAGFRLADVRVELNRQSGEISPTTHVRAYRPDDLDDLRDIARTSHRTTRFYMDPHFPQDRCGDLYDTWILRSCHGWADAVLVAEVDDRPAGYVTCHLDHTAKQGSIGLIAVAERARGQGLGGELVNGALSWYFERDSKRVSVVTQGANISAQRVFQLWGFRTSSTTLWLHRWYER